MTTTATLYASNVAATSGTPAWGTTTNATGSTTGTYATWAPTTNGATGYIGLDGFGAQTAIGSQPDSVDSVAVTVRAHVTSNTGRWTSLTVGLYDSAGVQIGASQTMTRSTTSTFEETLTFTGVSWADLSNLRVRVTGVKNGTQASTLNVDRIGIVVTYSVIVDTSVLELGLATASDPGVNTDHVLKVRAWQSAGTGGTLTYALYQGTTLIASFTGSLTGSAQEFSGALTASQAGNISDYSNLRVRLSGSGPDALTARVSHVRLVLPVAPQTLSPSGIASGEAIGTASISTGEGAQTLSPSSIASGEALGTATISPGAATVSPSGLASGEAFGTAALTPGAITVSPGGVGSAEAVPGPVVAAGSVSLAPEGVPTGEAFGTPSAAPGAAPVDPAGIASAEAVGTPTITAAGGQQTVTATGIASAEQSGTASLAPGAATVTAAGIASAEALGSPSLTPGAATLLPSGIASLEALGTPSVAFAAQVIYPASITDGTTSSAPPFVLVKNRLRIHLAGPIYL